MAYTNLIFDLDDTIIRCGIYYQNCKDEFIRVAHERTGISKDIITNILSGIDIASTGFENAFGKERFPRGFSATSVALDVIAGRKIDEDAAIHAYHIGESVFYAQYEPFQGVKDVLREYKYAGYKMFLLTKGVQSVQQFKIEKHGLKEFFDRSDTLVVPKKTPDNIETIIRDKSLNKDETIMIGDSARDDIGSAIGAGIDSVLIKSNKPTWAYENTDNQPTFVLDSVTELPSIIPIVPQPIVTLNLGWKLS
ncbi:MAG: HAD family hydrolase [Bacteroidetes bacterium]|nr:HAD family hydrolase [Bacteroidota bacterium]